MGSTVIYNIERHKGHDHITHKKGRFTTLDLNDGDEHPFTMGDDHSPNQVDNFIPSDHGVSERISNEGDEEGGSGDYRNQHRRGGN